MRAESEAAMGKTGAAAPTGASDALPRHLEQARRLVIKLGSSSVTDGQGHPRTSFLESLARELHALMEGPPRRQAVVVSSGAVALGWPCLGFKRRPLALPDKQAAAAVGQARLMGAYRSVFEAVGRPVAQVLLTADDIRNRARFTHAYRTFEALFSRGAVVIVNENDTVAVDEIRVGDNDTLSAMVAVLVEADLLVMLSDVDGLYTSDPRRDPGAVRVEVVQLDDNFVAVPGVDRAGSLGTGGMRTKLEAARVASRAGIPTVVARAQPGILSRILANEPVGTLFVPAPRALRGKRRWLAFYATCEGELVVDDGARRAVLEGGKSLLLKGILEVQGHFKAGSVVKLVDTGRTEFARGVTAYDADALRRLRFGQAGGAAAHPARGEENEHGAWPPEVVHRDNLVITARRPAREA